MTSELDRFVDCQKIDLLMEYRKWIKEIPFVNFPNEWNIKIIPPFLGAISRFYVTLKKCTKVKTSVYLDCYELLGFYGEPYYEVYPICGSPERCRMNDTERLLYLIDLSLNEQYEKILKKKRRRKNHFIKKRAEKEKNK